MDNFIVMFIRVAAISLMIVAGFIARRRGVVNAESTRSLSSLLMNYIYPPAIFASLVSGFTLEEMLGSWVYPVSEFLIFAVGFAVPFAVLRFFPGRTDAERRMFHYQCTLLNFSFMPLPLVLAMYGEKGVGIMSLGYVGGEIGVWTLGIVAITGSFSLKELKKALCMPMFAIMLAIALRMILEWMPFMRPADGTLYGMVCDGILGACRSMGAGTIAVSMIIAGSNMATLKLDRIFQPFHLTLAFCRLIVIPALCILVLHFMPIPEEGRLICYLIALMPCSIASAAYSAGFNADAETGATAILTTHIGSLVTVPLWMALLMR